MKANDYNGHYKAFVKELRQHPDQSLQIYCQKHGIVWRRLYDWMRRHHISLKKLYQKYRQDPTPSGPDLCGVSTVEFRELIPGHAPVAGEGKLSAEGMAGGIRIDLPSGISLSIGECSIRSLTRLIGGLAGKDAGKRLKVRGVVSQFNSWHGLNNKIGNKPSLLPILLYFCLGNMATRNDILNFARNGNPFSVDSLLGYFQSSGIDFNRRSLSTQLGRMVKANELRKFEKSYYVLCGNRKSEFQPLYNEVMREIAQIIRNSYPFMEICVWGIDDIKRISHYAVNRDLIYVEVDRDAVEGVFNLLTEAFPDRHVFINPTENEYNYYINGIPAIIVKPIRSEAPCLRDNEGILHPSIEKIMVDVICDVDFTPWWDYETVRLYESIFSLYDVSSTRLMRYARRRAKSDKINRLISEIKS